VPDIRGNLAQILVGLELFPLLRARLVMEVKIQLTVLIFVFVLFSSYGLVASGESG